jgi:hypothetical protein
MKTNRQRAIEIEIQDLATKSYDMVGSSDFFNAPVTAAMIDQSIRTGIECVSKLLAMTDERYDQNTKEA